MSLENEIKRYEKICSGPQPNKKGLDQFKAFESRGIVPPDPDPYFCRLLDGKKWWEWQLNEMARLRFTEEWPGWETWKEEYKDDPDAFRQLCQRCRYKP